MTGSYERHYRGRFSGNLEVQQLSGERIKFQLVAEGQVLSPGGPTLSSVNGVVPLRHGTAFYQKGDGRLALRFQGRKVFVSQSGDMQFALGVVADGVYVRHGRVPYFDPAFADSAGTDC